jgi:hypothetical protein
MKEFDDPPHDIKEIFSETFDEMFTEAPDQLVYADYPLEVADRLDSYTKEHSLDSADLLNLALEAGYGEPVISRWGEKVILLLDDFGLFDWPLEDPLSCVLIGVMRQFACRCARKADKKHEDTRLEATD